MSDTLVVSVVIPAYNAAGWIGETLESVLAQTFQDFEVIVVDDGSTDDTAAVVAGFGERVRCIQKPNGGQSSARNVGIRSARGEYIAFVDADDLWMKEKLQLQVDLLRETGLAWVYSDAIAFDGENGNSLFRFGQAFRQYAGDIFETLFIADFIPSPTPVIRKSVFEHVGYFDEDKAVQNREDWDMWLRIAACYPVGLVAEPLANYRIRLTSMTGSEDAQTAIHGHLLLLEKAIVSVSARLGPVRGRLIARRYVDLGKGYASLGQANAARAMFTKAIQYYPAISSTYIFWLSTWLGGKLLHRLHLLNVARRGY